MPHVELPQAEFKVREQTVGQHMRNDVVLPKNVMHRCMFDAHILQSYQYSQYTFANCLQVVLLGDSHTGKTSLVLRFVEGYYREDRDPTIGAFFLTKRVTVHPTNSSTTTNNNSSSSNSSITCKLLLWDTAGQAHFQRLAATYYGDAAAAIFTFDVSQPATLLRISNWLEEVQQKTVGRKMVLVVAACKCDLPAAPGLLEEGQRLAAQHQALFVETSAKFDQGTAETFQKTAQRVLQCHEQATSGVGLPIPVTVGSSNRYSSPLRGRTVANGNKASPLRKDTTASPSSVHSYASSSSSLPAATPSRNHSIRSNGKSNHKASPSRFFQRKNDKQSSAAVPEQKQEQQQLDHQQHLVNESNSQPKQRSKRKKRHKSNGGPGVMCDGSFMVCGTDDRNCLIM